jgi:hypothetical protein
MQQAALQGLGMVRNILQHREEASRQNKLPLHRNSLGVTEEPKDLGPRMRKHHHAIPTAHSTIVGVEDPGLGIIAHDMKKEAGDLGHQGMSTTMKTKKLRWGTMLYPQSSQNASTQRIQATT